MLEKGDEPVPGYRLEAFLGRGQFGEVWRATSPGGAQVALKFLNLDERQGLKEFRAIQRIKTIRYPHLVGVTALWLLDDDGHVLDDEHVGSYDAPPASNRDTLVPESWREPAHTAHRLVVATLLCDKNLLDHLADCQAQGLEGIPVEELLRYMEEAAKGIDFLNSPRHDLGEGPVAIQHCDIKPANIMLTGDSVMICDFGVAAFLSNPRIAATGTSMAGSPAYMSPECTQRKPSGASDQYSLAITYIELRTGQLPFHGESWIEVIEAHRRGTLDLSKMPPAEQDVLRKATAVKPEDRYPSCVAMVRALRRAVESADSDAPRTGPLRTVARIGLPLAVLVAIGWGAVQCLPWGKRDNAELSQGSAVTRQQTASFQVVPADAEVLVDGQAMRSDGEGRVSLIRGPDAAVDIEVRKPPEYQAVRRQCTMPELSTQPLVIRLERDPDYARQLAQQHARKAFEIIDSDPPHLPGLEQAVEEYRQAAQLNMAQYAVVPPLVRSLREAEEEYNFTVRCLAVHASKPWLVGRVEGTKIALWNLTDLDAPPTILHAHANHVCNVVVAGSYVASADLVGEIKVTRLDENGRPLETLPTPGLTGLELAITPDLHWLVAGDYEGHVHGWRLDSSAADSGPVPIGQHKQSVRGIVLTPDSQWAVTAGEDGTVCRWSLQTPNPAAASAELGSQSGDVFSLAISPDGRWVAVGGEAQSGSEFPVSQIDLVENRMAALPTGHTAPVSALAYDMFAGQPPKPSDWIRLVSGSEDGQVQIYQNGAPQLLNSVHTAAVKSLAFCQAPGWLLSGSDDGTVALWDLQEPQQKPLVLGAGTGRVAQVLATPKWIIAGYYNGAILLWDLRRCILIKRTADESGLELAKPSTAAGTVKT